MKILLEAIKFNHDSDSAMADAFNIRKNETESITMPEWQRGVTLIPDDSPAAYAISEVQGNRITIQAKFRIVDLNRDTVEIRAIDPTLNLPARSGGAGCLGQFALLLPLSPPTALSSGNVLGEVEARKVIFTQDGESDFETFALKNTRVESAGVSSSVITWQWQFRTGPEAPWTDFEKTRHRIYTVLKIPQLPWEQLPPQDQSARLPWTEVLDHACAWAASATTPDEAAAMITRYVYGLGRALVKYASGSSYVSLTSFNCTKFLQLLCDGRGMAQTLNCDDCATIVSTFANILGCALWQSEMGPASFKTNPILLIGSSQWESVRFDHHSVAWKASCRQNDEVFDACLQVDGDENPTQPPHRPLLAVNLSFGRPGDGQYRTRLARPPVGGQDLCKPIPEGTRQHRKIKHGAPETGRLVGNKLSLFLKRLYDTETFKPGPRLATDLISYITGQEIIFAGWQLDSWTETEAIAEPRIVRSLWERPLEHRNMLLRVDGYEAPPDKDICLILNQVIKGFELDNFQAWKGPPLGDIAFVEPENVTVVFARSQFVFVVRSAGLITVRADDFAYALDQFLIQVNGVARR